MTGLERMTSCQEKCHKYHPNLVTLCRDCYETVSVDGICETELSAGDGIYSLTITDYPAAGRYKFSITADDTDMKSYTMPGQRRAETLIHEDNIQMGESYLRLVRPGPFRLTVFGAVVHLSSIPSEDVVPPSKIGDLLINSRDNKVQHWCINNISNNILSPKLIP